jgi:hypothetical protein
MNVQHANSKRIIKETYQGVSISNQTNKQHLRTNFPLLNKITTGEKNLQCQEFFLNSRSNDMI